MALILIVDDSEANASLVQAMLESHTSHDVLIAYTGVEGWQQITRQKPDVVILDLRLRDSNIDGWRLIQLVRADESLRHTPIIVTSVEATPEDRKRATEAGCDVYFSKPFKVAELRKAVQHFVNGTDTMRN